MLGLVAGPVLVVVVVAAAVFVIAGPMLADLAKDVYDQIKATIEDIKDTWRSKL